MANGSLDFFCLCLRSINGGPTVALGTSSVVYGIVAISQWLSSWGLTKHIGDQSF